MGDITRRDLIGRIVGGSIAAILPSVPVASAHEHDSLDCLTENMLEELGRATGGDVKDYKVVFSDDSSFEINASILGYNIIYSYNGDAATWDDEEIIRVGSKTKDWCFSRNYLSDALEFSDHCRVCDDLHFYDSEESKPVFNRLKDLLDTHVLMEDSKGKNQLLLFDAILKKIVSLSPQDFDIKYDSCFDIEATFEKGDFKINYRFQDIGPSAHFYVEQGENWLHFNVSPGRTSLNINESEFDLRDGKMEKFPRKIYSEETARDLICKVNSIEEYLTSLIRNNPVENYTSLFVGLVTADIDKNIIVEHKRGEEKIVRMRAGESKITYSPDFGYYGQSITLRSGSNIVHIDLTKNGKLQKVSINGHPFSVECKGISSLAKRIDFIKNTYTPAQANFIITEAERFYDRVRKIAV